jgi:AP-2 complex subunit alpha
MAKVREKFLKGGLSPHERKKYIWKLIYAHILGYDVDFGHDVAVSLINCPKFSDKVTGYIAIGIMLNENADAILFSNCMDSIKQDLTSGHDVREALALGTLGNIGSPALAKELGGCVINKALTDSRNCPIYVRKKACLCLLSFLRRNKQIYDRAKWI